MSVENPYTIAADWMDPQGSADWQEGPAPLAHRLFPAYLIPPHVDLMSRTLAQSAMGQKRRVIITMPPRHSKSETVSHWFPVWYLDRFPDRRVILASYEADFAASWGRKVRDSIRENAHTLRTRIKGDTTAAHRWETTAGGGMVTAGVGGPITGRGANVLIIDDPIKNAEEAESELTRESIWRWWTSTAYTRLEPGGSVVIVMTRWHEDDLVGRLLLHAEEGGESWEVVNFPAVAEAQDVLGRQVGDPLWPQRYDTEALERIRQAVERYVWEALYQQHPTPPSADLCPFDADAMEDYLANWCRPPRWRGRFKRTEHGMVPVEDPLGEWSVWEWPKKGRDYIISADSAGGGGGTDASHAIVWDSESHDEVASYHGRPEVAEFTRQLILAGFMYGGQHGAALMVPESNFHGQAVLALLAEHSYPRVYRQERFDKRQGGRVQGWGFLSSSKTKPVAVAALQKALSDGSLGIRDRYVISECQRYASDGKGGYEASMGHDDRVVAAYIGAVILQHSRQSTGRAGHTKRRPYRPRVSSRTGY